VWCISALVLFALGCGRQPDTRSTPESEPAPTNNRNVTEIANPAGKIRIISDVPVSTNFVSTTGIALLSFDGRKLSIEFKNDRIIFDEKDEAKMPKGTKVVEVRYEGGKLSITADGTAVEIPKAQPSSQ